MRIRIGQVSLDGEFFIVTQMLISVCIIFFTLIDRQPVTSAFFALSFINLIFLFLTTYRSDGIASYGWIFMAWCVFSIIYSYLDSGKNFAFEHLVSLFTFFATVLYLQVVNNIEVNKTIAHRVLFIGAVSSALYPIGYYFLGANEFRNMGSVLLTMHFSSSNLTGMYLAQACLYSLLGFVLTKRKLNKLLLVVLFGFDFYFLFLSGARNSMIAVLMVIVALVFMIIKRRSQINHAVCWIVAIIPLAFAIAYLVFIDTIVARGTLDFIVEEGKPISSRVCIWSNVFQTLKGIHWLTGDFAKLRGNLHNTHITILGSYGVIGVFMLISYLTKVMKKTCAFVSSPKQAVCVIAFFGTIFMGNGEAALFYGSLGMYAIACSYLILARYDWDAEEPPL